MHEREWLTIPEGAKRARVSARSLWNYIHQGRVPAYRLGPRFVRVDAADIDRLFTPIPVGAGPTAEVEEFCREGHQPKARVDAAGGDDVP